MKLVDYLYQWDYGHEFYLNLFCTKYFNIFQFNIDWSCYPGRTIFLLNIFGESLFGFTFTLHKFNFCFDFFAYYKRDLNHYRY